MSNKIRVIIVIELLGRPKDHLDKAMKDFIEKINNEKGIKVLDKKVYPPKLIELEEKDGKKQKYEKGKEMYSNFSEIELEADEIIDLIRILFVYMPSHFEVLSPERIELKNFDFSTLLNELSKRMHQYDNITKNAIIETNILRNKIKEYVKQNPPKKEEKKEKEEV